MSYITANSVLDYLGTATSPEDLAFGDMEVTPEMLVWAMKWAAREWNGIAPFVSHVSADCLGDDTNIFYDGILLGLLLQEKNKLTKQDVDFLAGGSSVNLVGKRLTHINDMIKMYTERFTVRARDLKIAINLRQAYGQIG